MPKLIISLDFDDVICSPAPTLPKHLWPIKVGAKEAIDKLLSDGHYVVVLTARKDLSIVKSWMTRHFPEVSIPVSNEKRFADVYVDDKALRFETWNQTMQFILHLPV